MASTPTWFEGFEGGDKASAFSSNCGGTCSISGTGIADTTKHEGDFAFKANPADGVTTGYGRIYKALVATGAITDDLATNNCYVSLFVRAAVRPSSASEQILVVDQNNTDRLQLHLRSDGKLELFDESDSSIGISTTVLDTSLWYLVDVKYKYVAGISLCECELRIDGVSEVTSSSETFPSANVASLFIGKHVDKNNKGYTCYFDDVAICDGGYVAQPFLVKAVLPDADGAHTAWTGSYTDIDEAIPDGDTTTIHATVIGQMQSASCASVSAIASGREIVAVRSLLLMKRGVAGGSAKIFWRDSGGTDNKTATAFTLGAAYNNPLAQFYTQDPVTSAAWTVTGINASEIGAESAAADAGPYWTSGKIHLALAGSAAKPMIAYNFGG